MTTNYTTVDDEPLPDRVLAEVAPAAEWRTDPQHVGRPVTAGEMELYHVEVPTESGTKEVFMDKTGHSLGDSDHFVPLGDSVESVEYALNPNITHVHPDTKAEHVTRVIIATPQGVFKHYSRSGIAWSYHHAVRGGIDPDDVTDEMVALAESFADAPREHKPDRPGGWEQLTDSAWHSSMESSQLSEKINDITRGDAHQKLGWSFPVVVRFGDTRNCCSQPYTLYAPIMHADTVVDALAGSYGIGRSGLRSRRRSTMTGDGVAD